MNQNITDVLHLLKTKGGHITQDYVLQSSDTTSMNTSLLEKNSKKSSSNKNTFTPKITRDADMKN